MKAKNSRELKQAEYDLLKESVNDPVVSKLNYLKMVEDLYGAMSLGTFEVNHMSEDDPIATIINKFRRMASQD